MSENLPRGAMQISDPEVARRLVAYSVAAGLGAFVGGGHAEANVLWVDPDDIELTGQPFYPYGNFGYANAGIGLDIDQNGSSDVGIYRELGMYGGALFARDQTERVGDVDGYMYGSGAVTLLSNPDNIDPGPGGPRVYEDEDIQGFLTAEVIGDNEIGPGGHQMRSHYEPNDWDNVASGATSYLGFEIDLSFNGGTGTGFGWIEITITENEWFGVGNGFTHPEITITRWAYTNDGSAIDAGGGIMEPHPLLRGDANNDGQVTGADLVIVQQNFGQVGPPHDGTLIGDANDDGQVTGSDLIEAQQNFGNSLAPTPVLVPEPGSLALLAAGAGAMAFRQRYLTR